MHKCTLPFLLPRQYSKQIPRQCRENGKSLIRVIRPDEHRSQQFSTSRTSSVGAQGELTGTRCEALTLQYKTQHLLEPIFNVTARPSDTRSKVEAVKFWRDVLSDTFENLSTGAERPARIVVYSVDEWSGADDLVTALLDEPLSSDQTQEIVLRTRWKNAVSNTSLTLSSKPQSSPSICLSSSYLTQFSVPLEITELRTSSSRTLPSSLFKADVPIIVFNPITTPLSSLQHLIIPSHTIFVASANPHLNDTSKQKTFTELSQENSPHRILFLDPSRALSAIQTFRTDPTSALAIQQYQHDFPASGISLITQAIRAIVDSGANATSPSAYLSNRTAVIQLHDTLAAFYSKVQDVQHSINNIRGTISHLTGKIEEAKVRVPNEILGFAAVGEGGKNNIVGESVRLASKEMRTVLERMSWWKTIWRVDEVSEIIGSAVDRIWCKDLEQQLILQTGRLVSLQQEFTKAATSLVYSQKPLHFMPPTDTHRPLFTANILKNTISQLISSPSYTLTPSTLTIPTTERKTQLLTYPTTRLHLKAQRLLLSMSTAIAVSSGYTWAGWMGYLSQNIGGAGSIIWSTVGMGMDPMTGIGVGLLGVVGCLRWAVGRWENEKTRWWSDWERVGKGLERDLKATVDKAMKNQVLVVADAACKGLEELCEKRQDEVEQVKDELLSLQKQLKDINARTQT